MNYQPKEGGAGLPGMAAPPFILSIEKEKAGPLYGEIRPGDLVEVKGLSKLVIKKTPAVMNIPEKIIYKATHVMAHDIKKIRPVTVPPPDQTQSALPAILAPQEAQAAVPALVKQEFAAPVTPKPLAYLVTLKGCNVRPEANNKSKIVGTLKKGEQVEMVGKSGNWFNINPPSGGTGWVYKEMVKEEP